MRMKKRWANISGLSLVLCFGFLFLNGTTVFAEEEEGQPVSQEQSAEDFSESSAEFFESSEQDLSNAPEIGTVWNEEIGSWEASSNLDSMPAEPEASDMYISEDLINLWYRINVPGYSYQNDNNRYDTGPYEPAETIIESFKDDAVSNNEDVYADPSDDTAAESVEQNRPFAAELLLTPIEAVDRSEDLTGENMKVIAESDLSTTLLSVDLEKSAAALSEVTMLPESLESVCQELTNPIEFIISGTDIPLDNGTYSFRLVIRSDRTLTFDNELENTYQGIDGNYRLHYDIDQDETHTMIVDGAFANIITASPLLEKLPEAVQKWVQDHIHDDSYLYQLALKTEEGFSFQNTLGLLLDEKQTGFSLKYCYDQIRKKSSLIINGIPIFTKSNRQCSYAY